MKKLFIPPPKKLKTEDIRDDFFLRCWSFLYNKIFSSARSIFSKANLTSNDAIESKPFVCRAEFLLHALKTLRAAMF